MKKLLIPLLLLFAQACSETTNPAAIPGSSPVDIYLNLKNKGFQVEKAFNAQLGNLWECTWQAPEGTYRAEVFSHTANDIETIQASFMLSDPGKDVDVYARPFLSYIASFPYDGANRQLNQQTIAHLLGSDTTFISNGVKFQLKAPSPFLRLLYISKADD
jgi:hypothetical protein